MATTISWACATASERGSSHALNDLPNQDAAATFETDDGVAVAVADGHGGRRYVRSATGSAIAVEVARQLGAELLRGESDLAAAATALPARIVAEWRRRVDADLATHPIDPADAALIGDDPRLAYGATLLLVVCRRDQAVALQLGDGDVVVAWDDGTVTSPVPAEPRNVGGQTTSLCLPDADRSFRVSELGRGAVVPVAILAASDGYGNSFEHDDWAQAVMRDLLAQHRSAGLDSIFSAMPTWVAESAKVGGDDTTVALVFRSGSPAAALAAPPTVAPVVVPDGRPARRWAGLAMAALLGLAVGAVFGFVAAGDDDSGTAASTTLPAVSSDVPTTLAATRPSASTAAPATSDPSTPSSSPPTTVPPSSTPTTTPAPPTTPPPAVDQVAPDDPSVVMAAGPYQLGIDPFADPIVIESFGPGQGATPIMQLLTTGGRWDAVDATLRFTPHDGAPITAWELAGPRRVAGLAFSGGRVVAAAMIPGETDLTVGVFDGATGAELAIIDQVAASVED